MIEYTLAPAAMEAGEKIAKNILARGYEWFTASKYNEYEKELIDIINNSIKIYKDHHVIPGGKTHFIDSKILIDKFVTYRLFKDFSLEVFLSQVNTDTRFHPVTPTEIDKFLEIFSEELSKSTSINQLNVDNNYRNEIFEIIPTLERKMEHQTSLILNAIQNATNTLQISGNTDAVIEEWKLDLIEIRSNLEEFKTKTALERINKLEDRVSRRKLSLDNAFHADLTYIKASCMAELAISEIRDDTAPLFIKAAELAPDNIQYLVQGSLAQFVLNNHSAAAELADRVLLKEPENAGGWLTRCFIQKENILAYLSTVPENVRAGKYFKMHLLNFLFSKKIITTKIEVDKYDLDAQFNLAELPEKITAINKIYWVSVSQYLLQKIFFLYPTIGATGPSDKMLSDDIYEVTRILYARITDAVEGTELVERYAKWKFHSLYLNWAIDAKANTLVEIRAAYDKIDKPSYVEVINLCQVYNEAGTREHTQNVIDVLENFGVEKNEMIPLFIALNYAVLSDALNAIKNFKLYLSTNIPIDERTLWNTLQFIRRLAIIDKERNNEFVDFMRSLEFENASHKELFQLLHPTKELEESSKEDLLERLEKLVKIIPNTNAGLRFYVAAVLRYFGQENMCIEYLRPVIKVEDDFEEVIVYCQALYHGKGDKKELLKILEQARRLKYDHKLLLSFEINLRKNLRQYKEVVEISEYALKFFHNEEGFIYELFFALNELSDVEGIKRNAEIVKDRNFKNEGLGVFVANVLTKGKLVEQSLELLYNLAIRTNNPAIRQAYFTETVSQSDLFKEYTTVAKGLYVKYKFKEFVKTVFIDDGNINTSPFKEMIGKNKGDSFEFTHSFSNSDKIEILRIMNKYLSLFDEITDEANNPAAGYSMLSFKIEENQGLQGFKNTMTNLFGAEGDMDEENRKEIFQKYYSGLISFSELSAHIFKKNHIDAYFYLTQSGDLLRAIPSIVGRPQVSENTKYVIDLTTICLFYQLSSELGIKYEDKFIISKQSEIQIEKLLNEAKSTPKDSMRLNFFSSDVKTFVFDESFISYRIEFLGQLKNWVGEYCIVDNVIEKLNFLETQTGDLPADDFMMGLLDNRLAADREDHILLTNDIVYYRDFQGNTDNIISPEFYLVNKFAFRAKEISRFLLHNNYIGIRIDKDLLQEEFLNQLSGKVNKFPICLENLHQVWNPYENHIEEGIQFIKWLYLTNYIDLKIRNNTARAVLYHIIKGSPSLENINKVRDLIEKEFKLLGRSYDEVKISLLEAMQLMIKK